MDLTNLNKDRKSRRKSSIDLSTMVYGKVPPQNNELEKVVLGALMLDSSCLAIGMSKLFPEIFYLDSHQRVFKSIQNLYDRNTPIDIMNVVDQLKKNEDLDTVGGIYFVTTLTNSVVSGANIESHILVISEMYLKRQTIAVCGTAINLAYEDNTDAFDVISNTDLGLQDMQEKILAGRERDISYFGMKMIEEHNRVSETGVLGVNTGIKALDQAIAGLVAPDLIIIAARPGQGKTALALSITHNTSVLRDIPCAWFSLEMDGVQLVRRLASIESGISHASIRNGSLSPDEKERMMEATSKIMQSRIFIDDKVAVNVRYIKTRLWVLKKKYKIKYAVLDYLQLMGGTDGDGKNREQIISEISRGLKTAAKELEMPIIALSQLSRAVESRNDKMPQLSDLRESGAIEQDADEVIFLMRPEYYHMTESVDIGGVSYSPNGLCIANIGKNRHGSVKHVALGFQGSTMKFSDNGESNHPSYTPQYKLQSNPF